VARGRGNDVYVVDRINQKIRRIAPNGDVSTFATAKGLTPYPIDFGSAFGGGLAFEPLGCGSDIYGSGLLVVDSGEERTGNNVIRRVTR